MAAIFKVWERVQAKQAGSNRPPPIRTKLFKKATKQTCIVLEGGKRGNYIDYVKIV